MPDNMPMQTPGAQEGQQQSALLQQLMQKVMQPKKVGPQVQPEQQRAESPKGGMNSSQGLVHNLFGLIYGAAQKNKQTQVDHATARIKGISDAISDAYEMAQGDEAKAHEIFMASPAVKALMSKEGQKDMKQMEKLLQYDFLNPEKKKTVWHEGLQKVVQLSGAEKVMAGLRKLMGEHKGGQDKTAQANAQQGQEMHGQMQARELAGTMFKGAHTQEPDVSKLIGPISREEASAQLEAQRQTNRVELEKLKENYRTSMDKIKHAVDFKVAKAIDLFEAGDDEGAQKQLDLANKGAMAKKGPSNTLTGWIAQATTGDPETKKKANAEIKKYMDIQSSMLAQRGLSFGMGRLNQYVDQDGVFGEPGSTAVLNGYQMQDAIKGAGGRFTMVGPINPQIELAAQQVIRTTKPALDDLQKSLGVFDNDGDKAIIARVVRENPQVKSMDESTLGTWLDQNLKGQLSPIGQSYVQNLAVAAEATGRIAALTGQSRTGMNTVLLLGMLPGEDTPNRKYGEAQIQKLRNFLDGVVQAPILGSSDAGKKAKAKGVAAGGAKKGNPLSLPGLD